MVLENFSSFDGGDVGDVDVYVDVYETISFCSISVLPIPTQQGINVWY